MKLSIIIPVYNMANGKIQRCLDSLLCQTIFFSNNKVEIICVDDCSTDNSLEIINNYCLQNPSVIYCYKNSENHKQGSARNLGLSKCKGDYIFFVDSDDFVAINYIELLLNMAIKSDADIVSCNYTRTDSISLENANKVELFNTITTKSDLETKIKNAILNDGLCWNKIYSRNFLLGNKDEKGYKLFPEDCFFEDNAIMYALLISCKKYTFLNESLYFYYQNPSSTMHTFSWEKMYDRIRTGILLIENSKKQQEYEKYKEEIEWRFIEIFYINTFLIIRYKYSIDQQNILKYLSEGINQHCSNFYKNKYYKNMLYKDYDYPQILNFELKLLKYNLFILNKILSLHDFFIIILKIYNKIKHYFILMKNPKCMLQKVQKKIRNN